MPDLLLELFSEEIPARMQAKAAEDLRRLVTDRLVEARLVYEGARAFATPRRLALWVQGLPVKQPDLREERRGPRVGAPQAAIQGFLKSAGLASIEEATITSDPKKGDFYTAVVEKPGRAAADAIAQIVPAVVRGFPWPKAMRWGAGSAAPGALTWVRPLQSVVATFGPETEDPEIVPFSLDGIAAGDETRGHRFLSPARFRVKRLDDYARKLEAAKVVLDAGRRENIILTDARNLAFAQGFELVEDRGLLAEVAGLVEWPVVLMGSFDESFLSIPPEVIRTTIRNNQKCFVLRDGSGALAPRFILVSNIEAADGGKAIVSGNERVIRARLSDAKFFYETDLKVPLDARLEKLKDIVFHEKLGTQWERVERIERLARELAPLAGADPEKAARAARLSKADLVTEMVGEFPELQGLMGKYYALAQGEDESVARAVEEHYKPLGPNDRVPTDPVAVAVALADKIDTLVSFWAIDEKPTGSKDPYALRRAALGIVNVTLRNCLRLNFFELLYWVSFPILGHLYWTYSPRIAEAKAVADIARRMDSEELAGLADQVAGSVKAFEKNEDIVPGWQMVGREIATGVLSFLADRLKVQLREQGARHDLVDAVLAPSSLGSMESDGSADLSECDPSPRPHVGRPARWEGVTGLSPKDLPNDDLLLIVRRVEALGRFLETEDGKNLLAGYKRATNIIRIEEKKDARDYRGAPDPQLYRQTEERALADGIATARREAEDAVTREDFAGAMGAIATLRPRVDAFFDKVTVNVEEPALRENRLKLLNQIREATAAVADFSKIEG